MMFLRHHDKDSMKLALDEDAAEDDVEGHWLVIFGATGRIRRPDLRLQHHHQRDHTG